MNESVMVSHVIGERMEWLYQRTGTLYTPHTGERVGQVAFATIDVCEKAIHVAEEAFISWSKTPFLKRLNYLFSFRQIVFERQALLAECVSYEHGKTLSDAKGSVARALELIDYHCGLMNQMRTSFSFEVAHSVDCFTLRLPLGVCFGVSPFNFPVMVPIWMMIPAVMYGNTFILKPSEQTPSAPTLLVKWLLEAGFPPGVVNCVHGDRAVVDYFIEHPTIKAVTAVASTPVAQSIYQRAIAHGKRAHTFGGAKNHALVMPDADLEKAAEAIVTAAFGSAGERCMALSVVVTPEASTHTAIRSLLIEKMAAIRMEATDPLEQDMGPLISQAHRQRVLKYIEQGVKEGAKLLVDGRSFKHSVHPEGYFLGPCLFDAVDPSMTIYQEELFGPVLCLVQVEGFDEAIALINRHQYGNGACVFTDSGAVAREWMYRVDAGMVGINVPIPVPIVSHPFGGWKQSSFGDVGLHGEEDLMFYTRQKTITTRWALSKDVQTLNFSMPTHDQGE